LEDCLPHHLGVPGARLVRVENLPSTPPPGCSRIGPFSYAGPEEVGIHIPEAGRWRIRGGTVIEAAPETPESWTRVLCMTMASPVGALILQRGDLPLHAASLVAPGAKAATLLCASSGTGKSTTSVALARKGWSVLSDDVTQIVRQESGLRALPGWATVKLWPDSCTLLGMDPESLPEYPGLKGKRLWLPPFIETMEKPIDAVVVLSRQANLHAPEIRSQRGMEALSCLQAQTFRPKMIGPIGKGREHSDLIMALATQAKVSRIAVPDQWTPDQVAEFIESAL